MGWSRKLWQHFSRTVIYDNRGILPVVAAAAAPAAATGMSAGMGALYGSMIAAGGSMLGGLLGRKKKPTISVMRDPYKTTVSNPLSSYLATQVGKGLPGYRESTGQPLTTSLADVGGESAYRDLLAIDPSEWYTKSVQEPTMKAMREEIPNIEEGWAGSLRGSGRFRDVEDYMADTAETLAQGRYQAQLEIPQIQYASAEQYAAARNEENKTKYTAWLQTLAQFNPAFQQMTNFLNADSGWNVVVT